MVAANAGWVVRAAARAGLYYGWIVVVVALLVSMVGMGARMASGVMILPLEAEFGWDRATISFSLAICLLANGLGAPFGGQLLDRFGPRKMVLGAVALGLSAVLGTLVMSSLFELTLWWGLLLGLSTGAVGAVLGSVIANRWFVARRGLVTGLLGGRRFGRATRVHPAADVADAIGRLARSANLAGGAPGGAAPGGLAVDQR